MSVHTSIEESQAHKEAIERMSMSRAEIKETYMAGKDDNEREAFPISISAMRGEPSVFTLGTLKITLRPLKRREIRDKLGPMLRSWPEILQFSAAVRRPNHPGIDAESCAFLMSLFQASEHQREEAKRKERARKDDQPFIATKEPEPVSVADVEQAISSLSSDFDSFMPTICDTVWLLAEGLNPGLAWPRPAVPEIDDDDEDKSYDPDPPAGTVWLDDYLDDNLFVWDFSDLLRAILLLQGTFPGCLRENFTRP